MSKNRLEAFTDGVMAIIITIMVLEIDVPQEVTSGEMLDLLTTLLVYLISYIYVGIYWSNHHHLFSTVKKVNGKVLLSNLALLFFLSLIPFATKWVNFNMGTASLLFYGFCLIMSAIAYYILIKTLIKNQNSLTLKIYEKAGFKKEIISIVIYMVGILFSFVFYPLSIAMYALVAIIWIIPDKKMEKSICENIADES